jgi:hypothetical protein
MSKRTVSGFFEVHNDDERQTVPAPAPTLSPEQLAVRLLDLQAKIAGLREQERAAGSALLAHMTMSGTEAIVVGARGSVSYVPPQMLDFVDAERAASLLRDLGYPVPIAARFEPETLRVFVGQACIDPMLLADEDERAPATRRDGKAVAS